MRVLKVKGVGQLTKRPDLVVIQLQIVSRGVSYEEVMKDLNHRTMILRQDIMRANFAQNDLKTTQFTVDTEYRFVDGKKEFVGFKAIHAMKLEFPYNQKDLNRVLSIVSQSEANPLFTVTFEVKNKEKFKAEVLSKAVENAQFNAEVIATSAKIKLGKIVNIIYDEKPIAYQSNVMLGNTKLAATSIDIVPEDVKATDYIHVEYEIEDNI